MKSAAAATTREATVEPTVAPEAPGAASTTRARVGRPAGRGGPNFAEVPVAANGDDPNVEALRLLLNHLAGQLGLEPGSIRINTGPDAARRTADAQAPGVTHGGVIHIPQARLAPRTAEGRHLIAHEAAHVAQMRRPAPARRMSLRAELEAETFARSYVATRAAPQPVQVALPPVSTAAFPKLGELPKTTVAENHADEIAAIIDLMSYKFTDWAVTDEDVFDALQILAAYPLTIAVEIHRHVPLKYRQRLLDNLNPIHFTHHRTEILAACLAADARSEFKVVNNDILARMDLDDLDALEALAVDRLAEDAPKLKAVALEAAPGKAKRFSDAHDYVTSGRALADSAKTIDEGVEGERKLTEKREADKARVKDLPTDASPQVILARAIAAHIDEERWLRRPDAKQILEQIVATLPRQLDQSQKVRDIYLVLGPTRLDHLLSRIPFESLFADQALRDTFLRLAAEQPPLLVAKLAQDLSYSTWRMTTADAYGVYLLVRALPPRARAAFLKSEGGERWKRVMLVLPASVREDPAFNFYDGGKDGGRDQSDRQGLLLAISDPALWLAAAQTPAVAPPEEGDPGRKPPEKAKKTDPLDRLDSLIRLAVAAGEGAFVFKTSEMMEAYLQPRLAGLVERHHLYVPDVRTKYAPELPEKKGEGVSWLRLALGVVGSKIANLVHRKKGFEADISRLDEVAGARFRRTTEAEKDAAKAKNTYARNVLHIELAKEGLAHIEGPQVVIEALATAGETSVHSGPITITDLVVDMSYEPGVTRFGIKQLKWMDVKFKDLKIQDLSIALSDSIFAARSLEITGGHIRLANERPEDRNADALWLWKFLDVVMKPVGAKEATVAFTRMALKALAGSGGLYIDSIAINDFTLETAGDPKGYVRELEQSVVRLKARAQQERDEETAARRQGELVLAQGHARQAKRLDDLVAKAERETKAGQPHGSVVDIRKIEISGFAGVSEAPLAFEDIHGQGASVTAIAPMFMDPTSLRNLIRGQDKASTVRGAEAPSAGRGRQSKEETFSLDIGRIEAKEPLRLAGSIPTAKKAREDYEDFKAGNPKALSDPRWVAVDKALSERVTQAETYERLSKIGVQYLEDPKDLKALRDAHTALLLFEERRALIIESLTLEGVRLDLNDKGNPEIFAETLKTGTIRAFGPDGKETFSIGGVEGQRVSIGASLTDGLANHKKWREALKTGTLKAQQLTLKDIRHAGSGAVIDELAFEGDGDKLGLDATFSRGDPKAGGAGVTVRSNKIRAKGLNAPTQLALLTAEEARLNAIQPPENLSKDERKRLLTIQRMMRDYQRIGEAKTAAEAAAKKAKTKTARAAAAQAMARAEQALKDWQDRLVVEKLTVDQLDLSISGLGDVLAEDYSFDKNGKNLTVEGGTPGKPWFQQVQAEGIHRRGAKGDQVIADKVTVGPVAGQVKRTDKGYDLNGFTIASLSVGGLSWASPQAWTKVRSLGESRLEGLSIDASYVKDGGTTLIKVKQARLERLVADQLHVETKSFTATVKSGSLAGITLTGLNVTIPEEGDVDIQGQAAVQRVQSLAVDAVVGGRKIAGTIDSKTPGPEVNAISVNFAKAGRREVALQGLNADADVREGESHLHVALKNLSGTLIQVNADEYEVKDLSIPDVTVSGIHWVAGAWTIDAPGKVTLSGIALDAAAKLRNKTPKTGAKPVLDEAGEPTVERELASMVVTKLTVAHIAAKDLNVFTPKVEKPLPGGTKYDAAKNFHFGEAEINGLKITGFDVLAKTGKIEVTHSVKVTNLQATIGEQATGALKGEHNDKKTGTASFTFYGADAKKETGGRARELSATITAKDGTILKLGRLQGLEITGADLLSEKDVKEGHAPGITTSQTKIGSIKVPGVEVGEVQIRDDGIDVLGIDIDAPVDITNVSWATASGDKKVGMASAQVTQPMSIAAISLSYRQELVTDKKTGKKELQYFKEDSTLYVHGIHVPEITATGFTYDGAAVEEKDGKTVTKNTHIDLPNAAIQGVWIDEIKKGFDKTLGIIGRVERLTAPKIAATLTETIGTDVKTKTFGGELVATDLIANTVLSTKKDAAGNESTDVGGTGFTITKLGLKNLTGDGPGWFFNRSGKYVSKTPGQEADGLNADVEELNYNSSAGLSAKTAELRSLHFELLDKGVALDIESVKVPKGFVVPPQPDSPTAKPPPLFTLPEAEITNARFRVNDLAALIPASKPTVRGQPKAPPLLSPMQLETLLDHINGTITGTLFAPTSYGDIWPLDISVVNGALDYPRAWKKATGGLDWVASLQMDAEYTVGLSGDLTQDWDNSYLTLEGLARNQKTWTPRSQAERTQMTGGKVQLGHLIHPDGWDTKPEEFDLDENCDPIPKEAPIADPKAMELRKVDANLSLSGPIPLELPGLGTIVLGVGGKDPLSNLKVVGEDRYHVSWSVGGAAVGVKKLDIKGYNVGGIGGAGPVEIHINSLKDGGLDFDGGKLSKPGLLTGTIESATVKNLAVTKIPGWKEPKDVPGACEVPEKAK